MGSEDLLNLMSLAHNPTNPRMSTAEARLVTRMEAEQKAHKERMEQATMTFDSVFAQMEQARPLAVTHKRRRFCFCAGECTCRLSVAEEGMYHAFLNEQQQQYMSECEYLDEQFVDYYRRKNAGCVLDSTSPVVKRASGAAKRVDAKAARAVAAAEHDAFVQRCQRESWFLKVGDVEKYVAPVEAPRPLSRLERAWLGLL